MGRPIKKNSTDQSTVIRIIDSSDFTPETSVEHDTSGIDLWYRREGGTKVSITEAALASLDAAHSDGGFEHVGDGYYRLDLPDAAWATGSNGVAVGGTVTGMIVIGNYHMLSDYDPYDSVRLGLTALPNAAADAAGGLPISDAGGLDMDAILADTNELQGDWVNGGRLDLILDELTSQGDTNESKINTIDGIVDNIVVDTEDIQTQVGTAGAGLTAVPWNAAWDAEVQSECNDALVALNLDHLCAVATAAADMTTEVIDNSILSRVLASGDTSAFDPTTDSLQDIRDKQTDIETDTQDIQTGVDNIEAKLPTNYIMGSSDQADNDTVLDTVLGDTNELQTDWTNGGRLDLIIDELTSQGDTNEGKLDTIDGIVDAILVDTGTTLQDVVDAIQTDTEDLQTQIGTAGDGLTGVPWNASWDAEVQSEVDDALVAQKLDHLVAVADSDDVVDNSILAKMSASDGDWSGFDNSTDSLEAIRDRGDADWSSGAATNPNLLLEAEIASVTDQTHFTLSSGSDVDDSYNDQAIVLYDDTNSDYPSIRVIEDYTGGTKTVTIDSAPDFTLGDDDSVKIFVTAPGTSAPTAGQVADAVWDEATSGHTTGGTFGEQVKTDIDAILADTGTDGVILAADQQVDVVKISGDSVAADNLEATYDGTGYADDNAPATQAQIGNITNTGSAAHTEASDYTLTTGTQTANTYENTIALDGVRHTHTDNAGEMKLRYEFFLGSGKPSSVTVTGALTGINDDLEVHGYDWINSEWRQIGVFPGTTLSTNRVESFDLFTSMVGTGADLGKCWIQFSDGSYTLTTAVFYVDQIFVSQTGVTGDYALGSIWIDTNASNTNTIPGVDGLSTNPVSTWAAAKTLSTRTNINSFYIINGSSITLDSSTTYKTFIGQHYDLALGGQDISGSHFQEAFISGIGTEDGNEPHFVGCHVTGDITIGHAHFTETAFLAGVTITTSGADIFIFERCISTGGSPVVFDFNDQGATVGLRGWNGGITVKNMSSACKLTFQGRGSITIDSTCDDGGTIGLHGPITITDNVGGGWAGTLNDDSRIDMDHIVDTWETQSQSDPTGFHVNVKEINGTAQTANDNGADINAILVDTSTTIPGELAVISAYLDTEIAAILEDTGTTIPALLATIDGNVDSTLEDTGTTIPALIAALNNISAADVNAQVLDVLATDTFAEPSSIHAATASLKDKIGLLAALARNKLIQNKDNGTIVLRDDTDSSAVGTATISDDGTEAIRGKFS